MVFPYGKEDTDYNIDGVPSSGWIFNGATSVFWCRLRDLLDDEIRATFQNVDAACFSATNLINQFDTVQQCWPEELWRLDIERKYIRTFTGNSVDNSIKKKDIQYLRDMMQGRKKYQRRQWERNQELYYGTKELMNSVVGDNNRILLREYTPTGDDIVVPPDYTLKITMFQDSYASVMFGNGDTRQVRAKAGQQVEIDCPLSTMDDTQVIIYGANIISALSDLSSCYIAGNNFSMATRLKKLVIGNPTEGYKNTRLTSLTIGNNALLEELDIRNCGNLTGSLNFTQCSNLRRLYAEGTRINGVIFANNGKIETAHLPNTINTLTMRNLNSLSDFQCNFDALETLTMEGGTINGIDGATTYSLTTAEDTVDTLRTLNMYGINWTIGTTDLLNNIAKVFSSLLTGSVYVSGAIRQQEISNYKTKWPDLNVGYEASQVVTQYKVTFVNADGTELWTEWVDRGSAPVDPVTNGNIPTPTRESDAQYDYTYKGWDNMEIVTVNRTITAQYDTQVRSYKIVWWQRAGVKLAETTAQYGAEVIYPNELPTDTSEQGVLTYKIFTGWDKSTGFIKGDTDVYAVWDTATTPATGTELKDMTPAQIYAISMQRKATDYFEERDYFDITMGHDYDFSNVTGTVLCENKFFDGKVQYQDTDIKLFDENASSFTLAIDFELSSNNTKSGATLISCFSEDGNEGFRVTCASSKNLQWGNKYETVAPMNQRSMLVLRHMKGSNDLIAYIFGTQSNRYTDEVRSVTITKDRNSTVDLPLTFGAMLFADGGHDNYGSGWIYWAKYWDEDLGDDVAKSLAIWPHQTLRMEYAGADRYRLEGNTSQRANLSFVANNLLGLCYNMNASGTNAGGWDQSSLRKFLNDRFYKALDYKWQGIIRTVKTPATAGGNSEEIVQTENKIYVPSAVEMNVVGTTPYTNEGDRISYYSSSNDRRKFMNVIIPAGKTPFTGSVDPTENSANNVTDGDVWISSSRMAYYYVSKENMDKHGAYPQSPDYTIDLRNATNDNGVWVPATSYWTRSPRVDSSSISETFIGVTAYGNMSSYTANNSYGILVAFSV